MRIPLPALAAIACTVAFPSLAQERESVGIDEIIVTAQKRSEDLFDVPAPVSVISGSELEAAGAVSMDDLAEFVPTLTISGGVEKEQSANFQIRGVGTNVFSAGVEPSVSVVIDGIALARQDQFFLDLADIAQVEVLKGPQGILFGKNASAGVVAITTRNPTEEFEVSGTAEYSHDDDAYLVKGAVSGPIAEGLSVRLNAVYREADGHIENLFDGRLINGGDSWGLRGKLLWEPTEDFSALLTADYWEADSTCCAVTHRSSVNPNFLATLAPLVPGNGIRVANTDFRAFNERESWSVGLQIDWVLARHTLTAIASYREFEAFQRSDVDFSPFGPTATRMVTLGPSPNPNQIAINQGATDAQNFQSYELRLTSPDDQRVTWLLGAFWSRLEVIRLFDRDTDICLATVGVTPNASCGLAILGHFQSFGGAPINTDSLGLFGQAKVSLTERFHLTGGLRYTHEQIAFDAFQTDPSGIPLVPGGNLFGGDFEIDSQAHDTDWSGRLALQFDATDRMTFYVSWTQGYKGQAFDVTTGLTPEDAIPVAPETSVSWEIGSKMRLFDNHVQLGLAAFLSDYENFQAQAFESGSSSFELVNAGEARTQGFELELLAEPTENLRIWFSGAYLDAEFRNFRGAPCHAMQASTDPARCRASGQIINGKPLPNAPKVSLSGGARYDFDLASGWRASAELRGRWTDDVQFNLNQTPFGIQKDFGIVDISLRLDSPDERWWVQLFVDNLLDQDYVALIAENATLGGVTPQDLIQVTPRGAERIAGVRVGFQFP